MTCVANGSAFQHNISAVVIANGLGILLMSMILISRRKKMRSAFWDLRLFYWMCIGCFALCGLETSAFLLDGRCFSGIEIILRINNVLIYLLGSGISFLWVWYVDYKLYKDLSRLQRRIPFLGIPLLAIWILSLANLFTDVFFSITEQNTYLRRPLYYLLAFVMYGYLTYGALLLYRNRKWAGKYLYLPAMSFLIPVYVGSILQIVFYGLSLVWVSTALGLMSLYVNLQNEAAFIDPLTRLYNRNYLIHYTAMTKKQNNLAGILLDLNDFKRINDTCGHIEGDCVLQRMGEILRSIDPKSVAIRYGGDEFIILKKNAREKDIQDFIHILKKELQAWNSEHGRSIPVSVAIGISKIRDGNFEEFLSEMDRNLYIDKQKYYQNTLKEEIQNCGDE